MKIYTIHDLSNPHVINILKKEFNKITDTNIISNYHPDYSDFSGNLFYILANGRYIRGKYFIIVDETDTFIASAGWNELNVDVALVLTRMYVSPKFRTRYIIGQTVLPTMLTETIKYKTVWMTVNQYNKSIYNWLVRNEIQNKIGNWPDIYKNFKPIGQQVINNTLQYVAEYQRGKECPDL
jgi:hypothetical protein